MLISTAGLTHNQAQPNSKQHEHLVLVSKPNLKLLVISLIFVNNDVKTTTTMHNQG